MRTKALPNHALATHAIAALLCLLILPSFCAAYDGRHFKGRIAYSADGNHNDPDDWISSPVSLAILAEAGLKDRLVHFDYNCILPLTNLEWEKTHAESVLGAAERYGFDKTNFYNCRADLAGAIANLSQAINDSSADNPLYCIIAGPVEVPLRALQESAPAKRQYVYCISHSGWNDGYGSNYKYSFTKRSVIEQDVKWVQIRDQNARLSFGKYGRPATPEEFAPYFWMRDSTASKIRFLWERMLVSTRPDPSDAGMTWFVATGDEECNPAKLKALLLDHMVPTPLEARPQIRLEAENFAKLKDCVVESRNDRAASHRLNVRVAEGKNAATLTTRFDEPYTHQFGRYDLEIRYFDQTNSTVRFAAFLNGEPQGINWETPNAGKGWTTRQIPNVAVRTGDVIRIDMRGAGARVDYVQLNWVRAAGAPGK